MIPIKDENCFVKRKQSVSGNNKNIFVKYPFFYTEKVRNRSYLKTSLNKNSKFVFTQPVPHKQDVTQS